MRPDPGPSGEKAARCRACQLQLCKSRAVPPHPALREVAAERHPHVTVYQCGECGVTLRRSDDPAAAGWAAPRRAVVLARTTAEAAAQLSPDAPLRPVS